MNPAEPFGEPLQEGYPELEKSSPVPSTWYFVDEDQSVKGPFTSPTLHKASHFKECYVWKEGMADWVLKSSVPELQQITYDLAVPGYREEKARRQQKAIIKDGVVLAVSLVKRPEVQPARIDFANDPIPNLIFQGKSFCLSGHFLYGTRQKCIDAVCSRGGAIDTHPLTTTDYVVIGTMANSEWANGNYGRKIERALELRITHGRPAIITETTFVNAL